MSSKSLYQTLTYCGALPFVACALLPLFGVENLPVLGGVNDVLFAYALAILCFMAGVHWGVCLYHDKASPINLFIVSNVITLFAWFVFLLKQPLLALVSFVLAFALLLAIDYKLLNSDLITKHYFKTRVNVTVVVILSLAVAIGNL